MFQDDEFSVREIRNHLKKQISQFKTCQDNIDKAKSSFLSVLEGVGDFGIKKIVVKKVNISVAKYRTLKPIVNPFPPRGSPLTSKIVGH